MPPYANFPKDPLYVIRKKGTLEFRAGTDGRSIPKLYRHGNAIAVATTEEEVVPVVIVLNTESAAAGNRKAKP